MKSIRYLIRREIKTILGESLNRGAFVIDNKGIVHEVNYHGDIFSKKGFESLMDKAQKLVGYNRKSLDQMIEAGSNQLLSILDDAGFIRGGVFSPSKRELYFGIYPSKVSNKAKMGAIKKLAQYKPTQIYVEDLKSGKYGYMDTAEFAGEYL